jgi:hypothetical protein
MDFYNPGGVKAVNVSATITAHSDDFIEMIDGDVTVGDINANSSKNIDDAFAFKVNNDVPDNEYLYFTITCTDGNKTWNQEILYKLYAPVFVIDDLSYDDSDGNNNGFVDNGETIKIHLEGKNIGGSSTQNISVEGTISSQYASFEENNIVLNPVASNETFEAVLSLVIDQDTPDGEQFVTKIKLTSGMYEIEKELKFTVGTIKEEFETGDFSKLNWQFDNDLPWLVTKNYSHSGEYCAESGHIDDDEISSLLVEVETSTDGEISFYYKVSTEMYCDFFVFYIDGKMQERWSGQTDWEYVSFDVPQGMHTFEWRYDKNQRNKDGEDRCWVDDIVFPSNCLVLGVESFNEKKEFDVYPNPANTYIVVEGSDIKEVEVYDMMGRKVISSGVENSSSSVIYIDNLTSGIYLVRSIDVYNNVSTKKFIKK